MPWQSAPPLIIIAAMFTATGVGMRLVDEIGLGRVSARFSSECDCARGYYSILIDIVS